MRKSVVPKSGIVFNENVPIESGNTPSDVIHD